MARCFDRNQQDLQVNLLFKQGCLSGIVSRSHAITCGML